MELLFTDPMKVDRLPRPIGGERTWKGSSSSSGQQAVGGGVGGGGVNLPFAMDGLDPAAGWLGMYGSSNQQQGFPTGANQGLPHPPRVGGGDRGGIGRRYMEDLDANRILEMQQQVHTYENCRFEELIVRSYLFVAKFY